jgi:hypothetical protein
MAPDAEDGYKQSLLKAMGPYFNADTLVTNHA